MEPKDRFKLHIQSAIIAIIVAAITAAAPVVAAVIADYAKNSDKVDNFHAINATVDSPQRAGKIVAADSQGKLPNNIISKAVNADKLDGLDSTQLTPTAIYGFKDGPVLLPSVSPPTPIASMDVPAGSYVITSKHELWNFEGAALTFSCTLQAGSNYDKTTFRITSDHGVYVNQVANTFSSPGKITLTCGRNFSWKVDARWIKITAVKVKNLTKKSL